MDTVSMLNTMSFYCQPILPLVYDESMSYYETLCKVVGQLNTTGETVNKLNEGLTGEIADRQKADNLLNERLKVVEATNKKTHFLTFAGTPPYNAKPVGAMPTRSELYQWVNDGDMIVTLLETTDEGRKLVYAASCSYNAGNWADELSEDFNIIVPISTTYDASGDYAVRQKIAKITIPDKSKPSLDVKWGLQFIDINTPSTAANGVVNFAANISETGSIECNLTPFEFMQLYAPTWANKNLCVAVNAKLIYDGYTRTSSIATLNSTNHLIRIAFGYDGGVYTEHGVKQLSKTLDYIIGNVSTNTWAHESIDSKVFDFPRYEGFQFTRGAHNVITTNDESTPNAVYAQYHSDTSGKLYQNLPTRLIDSVDGAEYWNGTFDIYGGNHMTFTFVTSNYATASDKMLVRVIELSADVGTTAWKYGVKEFELPITGSFTVDDALSVTSTNPVQNRVVTAALSAVVRETIYPIAVTATSAEWVVNNGIAYKEASADRTFDNIKAAYNSNKTLVCEFEGMTYSLILGSPSGFVFASYRGAVANDSQYAGLGKYPTSLITINTTGVVISRTAGDLPAVGKPDNGKMLIVTGGEWALQKVAGATVDAELSTTSENPVQNKTVTEALNGKLPMTGGTVTGALRTNDSFSAGGSIAFGAAPIVLSQAADDAAQIHAGSADVDDNPPPLARLKVASPIEDDDAVTKEYVDGSAVRYDAAQTLTAPQQFQARKNIGASGTDSPQFKGYVTLTPPTETVGIGVGLSPTRDGNYFALDISDVNEGQPTKLTGVKTPTDTDTNAAATVEYVKAKVAGASGGAPIAIKLGTGNAATSTATFAEIKAALEAGNAPILDSATGTAHWFALNWVLNGSSSLSIQYGTFEVTGEGAANFSIYDVGVSSSGITYAMRQFSTE